MTIKRHDGGREDAFDISPAEVQAAARLQDRYHIYRVHFGDGDARIECIPDPLALLRQSKLRLCIVLPPTGGVRAAVMAPLPKAAALQTC